MDIDQTVRCMFYISKLKTNEITGVSEKPLEIEYVDWFHFEKSEKFGSPLLPMTRIHIRE